MKLNYMDSGSSVDEMMKAVNVDELTEAIVQPLLKNAQSAAALSFYTEWTNMRTTISDVTDNADALKALAGTALTSALEKLQGTSVIPQECQSGGRHDQLCPGLGTTAEAPGKP